MAVAKMRIEYANGDVKVVRITPLAMAETEERFGGIREATQLQSTFFMAWRSLNQSGQEPNDYQTWLNQIADCSDADEEGKPQGVDPTPPAPSPEPPSH